MPCPSTLPERRMYTAMRLVVDLAEGYYSFTYHILDADKLTVAERDKFLEDVVSEVQNGWIMRNADRSWMKPS